MFEYTKIFTGDSTSSPIYCNTSLPQVYMINTKLFLDKHEYNIDSNAEVC